MARYTPLVLGFPGTPKLSPNPPEGQEKSEGVLLCPKCRKCRVTLAVAAVWVQVGIMNEGQGSGIGSVEWQTPVLLFPITMTLGTEEKLGFDAVRVWRFSPAGEEPQIAISVE